MSATKVAIAFLVTTNLLALYWVLDLSLWMSDNDSSYRELLREHAILADLALECMSGSPPQEWEGRAEELGSVSSWDGPVLWIDNVGLEFRDGELVAIRFLRHGR